jgi:hypothetical protein
MTVSGNSIVIVAMFASFAKNLTGTLLAQRPDWKSTDWLLYHFDGRDEHIPHHQQSIATAATPQRGRRKRLVLGRQP